MESRIPVPTDNIYKFYALFGLLLFIFAVGAVFYNVRATNELIYSYVIQSTELRSIQNPTPLQSAKLVVLDKQREIALSDKQFFQWACAAMIVVAFWAMGHGFRKWQLEIQPVLDETAKTQLEIAKLQLEKLRGEVKPEPQSTIIDPPGI
jgi:hypothetical protein